VSNNIDDTVIIFFQMLSNLKTSLKMRLRNYVMMMLMMMSMFCPLQERENTSQEKVKSFFKCRIARELQLYKFGKD